MIRIIWVIIISVQVPIASYFGGISKTGFPMTFCEGRTSFTTFKDDEDNDKTTWNNCEKYEEQND